jgi:hypothetical protein
VSGSFFILPTNVCDYLILSTQLTELVTTTNLLAFISETLTTTNTTTTNVVQVTVEFSRSRVTYFTNEILVAYPVTCPDQITTLFQGIERINWVRRDYDSLLGQFFQPATNNQTMMEITNSVLVKREVERTVTAPDYLFSGDIILGGPTDFPPQYFVGSISEPNYVTPTNINVLGPGIIDPSGNLFTLHKVGPAYANSGPSFLTQVSGSELFRWGSFDGSTNAPIVYPVGTDLQTLENLVIIGLSQPTNMVNGVYVLPQGTAGLPYEGAGFQLEVIGGQPPYSWDTTVSLPPGLTISTGGLISGTPSTPGIYDFTIRMTESAGRQVPFPFTLEIN